MRILVVDDEQSVCWVLAQILREMGHETEIAASAETALPRLEQNTPDLLVTDYRLGGKTGLELLKEVRERWPGISVILITAHGNLNVAVEAMKGGAVEYLPKPLDLGRFKKLVRQVELGRKARAESSVEIPNDPTLTIVGQSPAMQEIFKRIGLLAGVDVNVLITGESGTGKELVARALHDHSARKDGPFVAINCGCLPETLVESELFGYEQGAFTGAGKRKDGKVQMAHGGTLFLDEIGEINAATQVKLLRLLEEKQCTPIGSTQTQTVDVRILSATNRDLLRMVEEGSFRTDLYYRLTNSQLELPPLRTRREDVPALIRHFLNQRPQEGKPPVLISEEARKILSAYDWPGNVRELRNVLLQARTLATENVITAEHLPTHVRQGGSPETSVIQELVRSVMKRLRDQGKEGAILETLDICERELLVLVLEESQYNQVHTARILGLNRNTLRGKIQKYGLIAGEE